MVTMALDAQWQPASSLFTSHELGERRAISVVGVPTFATSLTPRSDRSAPRAIRAALDRFSTYMYSLDADLADLVQLVDLGDLEDPDGADIIERLSTVLAGAPTPLIVLGGDNAATHHALRAVSGDRLDQWALITFDAHLDVRDGVSNGSPVRQLVDAGLDGANLTQIGLADFSNSGPYAARVANYGSTVVPRAALRGRSMSAVVTEACDRVSPDGRPIYVDLDMDVADRSVVPGCPAAAPGGLSADDLREISRACGRDHRVAAIDVTEIDPARDDADERTVRLAALCLLEFAAGVAERTNS